MDQKRSTEMKVLVVVVVLVLGAGASAPAQVAYEVKDLGDLGGNGVHFGREVTHLVLHSA